jgi:hypothetical protein
VWRDSDGFADHAAAHALLQGDPLSVTLCYDPPPGASGLHPGMLDCPAD